MTEYTNTPILPEKAKELMSLDTEYKEIITYGKIEEWFTAWDGKVYVSFSGGKDSTVLAYLAANWLSHFRTPPWPLNLVFINTGLEYPEIQKFVNEYTDWLRKKFPRVTINLTRLRPKMNIRQVVTKYGYSIVSKEVAGTVYEARKNPNCVRAKKLRGELLDKEGKTSMYNCDNWAFLLDAPFSISDRCCHVMKKASAHRYDGESKEKPMRIFSSFFWDSCDFFPQPTSKIVHAKRHTNRQIPPLRPNLFFCMRFLLSILLDIPTA